MKIEWTEPSISDLQHIRDFIAKDSKYFAARFIEKIIFKIDRLPDFPKLGRVVIEANDEAIRELIYQKYRIMYRVEKERILILAIIHGSRDLEIVETKPWEII
jgi:plasmid stabilization system protein ParE